jgi:hypothetical protein
MPTKEQTIEVDRDSSSKSQPKNLDRTLKASKIMSDAVFTDQGTPRAGLFSDS